MKGRQNTLGLHAPSDPPIVLSCSECSTAPLNPQILIASLMTIADLEKRFDKVFRTIQSNYWTCKMKLS